MPVGCALCPEPAAACELWGLCGGFCERANNGVSHLVLARLRVRRRVVGALRASASGWCDGFSCSRW
jgi:hypothetical protein